MNEEDVRFTYKFLGHEHETEIRLIDPRAQLPPRSVFVYSEDEFVKVCAEHEGRYNIYTGINERRAGGTKREDVLRVGAIPIDADPVRPDPKQASTDEEMALAVAHARAVQARQAEVGLVSLLAESGNGAQLWLKADIREHLDRAEAGIQQYQRDLAAKAPSGVRIDNIGDLPRIIKVIGTLSVKGDGRPPRPHRLSRWLDAKVVPPVNREFMDTLLAAIPAPAVTPTSLVAAQLTAGQIRGVVEGLGSKAVLMFDGRYSELVNLKGEPYRSRNEAESALASICSSRGLAQDVTVAILGASKIGKWNERSDSYRRSILKSAFARPTRRAKTTPPARAGDESDPWADKTGWEDEPKLEIKTEPKEVGQGDNKKTVELPVERAYVVYNSLVSRHGFRPFRTLSGEPRVAVATAHGVEVHDPLSSTFVDWIGYRYYAVAGDRIPGLDLRTAAKVLAGRAAAPELPRARIVDLSIRVAPVGQYETLLDLGDPERKCVRIGADGWHVERVGMPVFERPSHMLPLPEPERAPGKDGDWTRANGLFRFVSIGLRDPDDSRTDSERDDRLRRLEGQRLLVLVAVVHPLLSPRSPKVIPILNGDDGSGKSHAAAKLGAVTDPSIVQHVPIPETEQDLLALALNRATISLDNVSRIEPWLSDALARLCTGTGLAKRRLYTDRDEVVSRLIPMIILNGITAVPRNPDLIRRVLFLWAIKPERTLGDEEYAAAWEDAHPRILGGLLDLACLTAKVLRDSPPAGDGDSMADFVRIGRAVALATGRTADDFDGAWSENQSRQLDAAEENPWVGALRGVFAELRPGEAITPEAIARRVSEAHRDSFPKGVTSQEVGNAIARTRTTLRSLSLPIESKRGHAGSHLYFVGIPKSGVTGVTQTTLTSEKVGDTQGDTRVTPPSSGVTRVVTPPAEATEGGHPTFERDFSSGNRLAGDTQTQGDTPFESLREPGELRQRVDWLRKMGFSEEADALEAHPEDYKVPARGTVTPPPDGGEP